MMHDKHRRYERLQMLTGAIAGGLVSISMPVLAADMFDNNGIQFDKSTIVEFEFVESNGAYQSTLGLINLDTGEKTPLFVEAKPSDTSQDILEPSDYQDDTSSESRDDFYGSPGNAVPEPLAEFEFKANTPYAFYLESSYDGRSVGIFYSTDARNDGRQRSRFTGGLSELTNGGTLIRWDDTGSVLVRSEQQDSDFDDFIVRIGGHLACSYSNVGGNQQANERTKQLGNSPSESLPCKSTVPVK